MPELALSLRAVGARGRTAGRTGRQAPGNPQRSRQARRCRRIAHLGPDVLRQETPRRLGRGSGPRPSRPNRSWPTTCRSRTATTPPAPRHWPVPARARTTRRSTMRPEPAGGSRPLTGSRPTWRHGRRSWTAALRRRRQFVTQTLQHWKADTDLVGLRDDAALAKLPRRRAESLPALWAEVDVLLAKSRGTNPKSGK